MHILEICKAIEVTSLFDVHSSNTSFHSYGKCLVLLLNFNVILNKTCLLMCVGDTIVFDSGYDLGVLPFLKIASVLLES